MGYPCLSVEWTSVKCIYSIPQAEISSVWNILLPLNCQGQKRVLIWISAWQITVRARRLTDFRDGLRIKICPIPSSLSEDRYSIRWTSARKKVNARQFWLGLSIIEWFSKFSIVSIIQCLWIWGNYFLLSCARKSIPHVKLTSFHGTNKSV